MAESRKNDSGGVYFGWGEVWAVEEVSFEGVAEGAGRATPVIEEPNPNC